MPLYCNAALAGLPLATVTPLQRVQDSAARLIFQLNTREHVTPCLLQSQWHLLPVAYAGVFSANCMCCVVHSVCYITERVQRVCQTLWNPSCQTDAFRYTGLRSTSSTYHRCALRGAIKKFCNLATKSYHIICCHFLIIMQHQWLFLTFVLCCLCFDNRIFSVLTLRPCIYSDLQWFIVHKPGSTKTVLQISY